MRPLNAKAVAAAVCAAMWVAALLASPVAYAGRSCDARPLTVQAVQQGMALAQRTADALEAAHVRNGVRVVLLARMGQDLSRYGLRYSHLGFAYKSTEGPWRVLHKLNTCGTATSVVVRQGLGEFFLDDLWRYEAAWMPLPADWQARLMPWMQDDARAAALHSPAYSMVSYAWGTRYQQSNQWALETLAAAQESGTITTREQAQAWLRFKGYAPGALRIGALARLGGRLTSANIEFDDHPSEQRFADRIETVTVDSVFAWLTGPVRQGEPVVMR